MIPYGHQDVTQSDIDAVVQVLRSDFLTQGPAVPLFERGLAAIDALEGLDEYHLLHAARADLLRRLDRREEAAAAYRRALELVTNAVERDYLARRLESLR